MGASKASPQRSRKSSSPARNLPIRSPLRLNRPATALTSPPACRTCPLWRLSGRVLHAGGDVNAVAGLFSLDGDLIGRLRAGDDDFLALCGLHFDAPIGDVLDHNHGAAVHPKMLLEFLCR